MAKVLISFGLKRGDKITNQVRIPEWIKQDSDFSKRCIRGLIDSDGCVYFCKRDRHTYIKFTNHNLFLLSDFRAVAKSLGYNFAKANKWNVCLYRKDEVVRFINDVKPFKPIGAMGQW